MNSDKWILERLEFGTKYALKIGDTTIGRHKAADIITSSGYCSRQHCIITLNPDDSIYITNQVRIDYFELFAHTIQRSQLKWDRIWIWISCLHWNFSFDQSNLNGTFVNSVKIEERHQLKVRDVIGLGCDESIFQTDPSAEPIKKDEFFVFRLTYMTDDSIEISDDDDVADNAAAIPLQNNGKGEAYFWNFPSQWS